MARVAVVGAGVIGLSVGLCLCEEYGNQLDVTIIAEKFSPDTTSDRAGAIFLPSTSYLSGGDEQLFMNDTVHWATDTFYRLKYLLHTFDGNELGIHIAPLAKVSKTPVEIPWFHSLVMEFRTFSKTSSDTPVNLCNEMQTGWYCKTFIVKTSKYLSWMMQRVREKGGLIVQQKVESLSELYHYDVIVNCTGLSSRELVGDKSVFPVRGQIVIAKAPNFPEISYHEYIGARDSVEDVYTIPHKDLILLGGTAEVNNWSTVPDPKQNKRILSECTKIFPVLKNAEIVGSYACLRPVRHRVRLEVEESSVNGGPVIIHNYGHGGQGVVLHWGCALNTLKLVHHCLQERGFPIKPHSKL